MANNENQWVLLYIPFYSALIGQGDILVQARPNASTKWSTMMASKFYCTTYFTVH